MNNSVYIDLPYYSAYLSFLIFIIFRFFDFLGAMNDGEVDKKKWFFIKNTSLGEASLFSIYLIKNIMYVAYAFLFFMIFLASHEPTRPYPIPNSAPTATSLG